MVELNCRLASRSRPMAAACVLRISVVHQEVPSVTATGSAKADIVSLIGLRSAPIANASIKARQTSAQRHLLLGRPVQVAVHVDKFRRSSATDPILSSRLLLQFSSYGYLDLSQWRMRD